MFGSGLSKSPIPRSGPWKTVPAPKLKVESENKKYSKTLNFEYG